MPAEELLEQRWREYGREQYEQHGHYHEVGGYQPRLYALVGDDERDLAARHHADARDARFPPGAVTQAYDRAAAHDFAHQPDDHKQDGQQYQPARHAREGHADAYPREEHGAEYHIAVYLHLAVGIRRGAVDGGEHDSRDVRARDVRNAEYLLGGDGVRERDGEAEDGQAAGMRPLAFHPHEEVMHGYAHAYRHDEERHDHDERAPPLGLEPLEAARVRGGGLAEAADDGQHDYADDVVDYRGGDQRRADARRYLAQLFEHGHGYGHAGGGEDRTHEHALHDVREAVDEAVEDERQADDGAERERYRDARDRHEGGRDARTPQFNEVGLKARREHYHDHAYLGEHVQHGKVVRAVQQELVQRDELRNVRRALVTDERETEIAGDGRPDEYARYYIAEHLRKSQPAQEHTA